MNSPSLLHEVRPARRRPFAPLAPSVLIACAFLGVPSAHAQSHRAGAAAIPIVDHRCVDEQDRAIPAEALEKARDLRVLFGHQSVGFDVIRGLRLLGEESPDRYRLPIQSRVQAQWFVRNAGLGEFFVGRNGDAQGKVDDFDRAVRGGMGERVDVAMMKLCYADMVERSDPAQVFEHWRQAFEKLEVDYPKVRFVWWTCPLTIPPRCSDQRMEVNRRIREYARAQGKLLLDIADIECHTPQGEAVLHPGGGEKLDDAYARDRGGHLNDDGARRVGRAYWWLMARIAGWAGPR